MEDDEHKFVNQHDAITITNHMTSLKTTSHRRDGTFYKIL